MRLGPGSMIGGCRILAHLEEGGMGSLWLATRRGPGGFHRLVAVKVVHPKLARRRKFVSMFLDEARVSAQVEHPNVVHVEELGEQDGFYYLVMEYVKGCAASSLLQALGGAGRHLPVDMAVHVAMKVADGLHAAHETTDKKGRALGLVHRDVSPQNVLISYGGHVKLIDFGVAHASRGLDGAAEVSVKGKVAYMPPEQARGEPIDRTADVFALGVVLWEMLTGRRMHRLPDADALLDAVRDPSAPTAPSVHRPEVEARLDRVVLRALALDPAERFETAQAFRRALGRACPAAHLVEPDALAALLRDVLSEDIRQTEARLAATLAGVTEPIADGPVSEVAGAPAEAIFAPGGGRTEALTGSAEVQPVRRRGRWPAILLGASAVGLAIAVAIGLQLWGAPGDAPPTSRRTSAEPAPEARDPGPVERAEIAPADPTAAEPADPERADPEPVEPVEAPTATPPVRPRPRPRVGSARAPASEPPPPEPAEPPIVEGVPFVERIQFDED